MEKVTGIGGIFFRSKDPKALAQWYLDNLGIALVPTDMNTPPWTTEAGVTVFAPFSADTDYFAADKQVMVNFRVANLDAMIAQLAQAGTEAFNKSETPGLGKFAQIHDPEGNPIELWEPA